MHLRLKHPAEPEFAKSFAEDIVASARQISRVELDYSPHSLAKVDAILEGFREERLTIEQMGETLFSFGCYVGEVIVRNASGRWLRTEATPMKGLSAFPMIVEVGAGSGNLCNPIGKVFKRFENGAEDNLSYFYQVFAETN